MITRQVEVRKLDENDIKRIIEEDLEELLCPFFDSGFCLSSRKGYHERCFNPREYEWCPFYSGKWEL